MRNVQCHNIDHWWKPEGSIPTLVFTSDVNKETNMVYLQ